MSKLRFDPVNYQFYYRCPFKDGGPIKAAGFKWDALRRRYYTVEPQVAAALASRGDDYVKLLLADVLGTGILHEHTETAAGSRNWIPSIHCMAPSSNSIH